MAADYPASITALFSDVVSGQIIDTTHINRIKEELIAAQTELGKLPKGSSADVSTRLDTFKIIQIGATTKTDTFSVASATFTDITGLSVTITPSAATNRILVGYNIIADNTSYGVYWQFRLMRDSTPICIGDASGSKRQASSGYFKNANTARLFSMSNTHLDSPASIAAITYKVQVVSGAGYTGYINRGSTELDSSSYARYASNIWVAEVVA